MSTVSDFFKYSEVALAAYASTLPRPTQVQREEAFAEAGMARRQASAFENTWQVLSQSPDTPDGLSATLFQHRTSGEKVLAICGTDFDHTGLANATHLRLRLTPCEA